MSLSLERIPPITKTNSVEGLAGNENIGAFPTVTSKTTIPPEAFLANLIEEHSV
jgi:hypothetical protein